MTNLAKFMGLILFLATCVTTSPSVAQDNAPHIPIAIPSNSITSVDWSPDGTKIVTVNNNGTIQIRDAVNGMVLQTLATSQPYPLLTAKWSPNGTQLAATVNTDVIIWDTSTWQVTTTLIGHLDPVWMLEWSPNSSQIASVSPNGMPYFVFFIWDTSTGQQIRSIEFQGYFYTVDWSPNSELLLTTGGLRLRLWDADTTSDPIFFEGFGEQIDAKWSPDGTKIASGGEADKVFIWDVTTGQVIQELLGYQEEIENFLASVSWSPDGTKVAAGSTNGTIRVWDASTGQESGTIEAGSGVYSLAWSPDGTKIAYGGESGTFEIMPAPSSAACTPNQTVAAGDVAGLINAINTANANPDASVISVEGAYTFTSVNNGLNALPKITTDIKICAQNGATLTRQAGSPAFRFFEVASNGTLTLENLTLSGAEANAWVTYEDDDLALRSAHTGLISKMLRLALP